MNLRINIKYSLTIYLILLLGLGAWHYRDPRILFTGFVIVGIYALLDLLWTRFRDGVWYIPLSSFISALILAIVGPMKPDLFFLVLAPLLAVFSKQVIYLGMHRHIFNPAAFALGIFSIAAPSVTWWGVTWGIIPNTIIIIAGLVILYRQNRWETFLAFFAVYFLLGFAGGEDPSAFRFIILDPTFIFFATVMLIEPMTTNFQNRANNIVFGALVGIFAFFLPSIGADPLIHGLLLGNVIASFFFLKLLNGSYS